MHPPSLQNVEACTVTGVSGGLAVSVSYGLVRQEAELPTVMDDSPVLATSYRV